MIEFQQVSKQYENTVVIEDLSFTIEKGEFVTILGSSGSGKSTILKMINRLIEPSAGKIFFNGSDIALADVTNLRRQIGYVVQQIGLFPHMTVEKNIAVVPQLLGWDKAKIQDRVKTLLDLIQLPYEQYANRYPSELSGGQQQRVGVARALAADPNVMLFDEPFGAIDAITRMQLQDELLQIHQKLQDKTFIFITHDIFEALKLGTKVLILEAGKIVQYDTPKNIITQPSNEYVKKLIEIAQQQDKIWEYQHA